VSDFVTRTYRAGSHFFTAEAMRFFSSRLLDEWHLSDTLVLFITSERDGQAPRRYTLRRADFYDDAGRERVEITSVGAFQGHETLAAARRAARAFLIDGGHRLTLAVDLMTSAERNAWSDALRGFELWERHRGYRIYAGHNARAHAPAILERLASNGVLLKVPASGGVLTHYVNAHRAHLR